MLRAHLANFAVVAALACCSPAWAVAPSSTNYAIPTSTLNAGVGQMGSASYKLSSSLGDPFSTGPGSSANYRLTHGFWLAGGASALAAVLVSAVSRKVHGAAGTFDLALSLVTTNPTTEPRQGPAATVVLTFDKPVIGANVAVAEGVATAAAPTFSGNDVIVGLGGVTNAQYVTVALTGVAAADGGTGGSGAVRVGFLAGDVNGNRAVTLSDLLSVNAALAQTVAAATFLRDVNMSGTLSLADILLVNSKLTHFLPAP